MHAPWPLPSLRPECAAAYGLAGLPFLAPKVQNDVVKIGKAIADASQDSAAQRTWSQRNPIP
jgi:hypothetical protein